MPITLITGGSRGLGKSMALHLAAHGNDIILTYHSKQKEAEDVVAEIKALGRNAVALQLDVARSSTYPAFVSNVKQALQTTWNRTDFDHLVNNAGIGINAPYESTTEEQFDQMVNIHLKAAFFLSQKLLPLMRDGGSIVHISSGLARFSFAGYAAYGTMKAAIDALTRYMALELGPRGIRVNSIAPGAIETDFGGGHVRDNADMNKMIASQTALGRVGLPDDIGGAVAMLLAPENTWLNGQRIEASGGFHL
jgi:NAD(P)-dependent dehydrogenase (short-subunit alcohol dehydrogenase family)